jgi:hypothetical protein
VPVTAANKDCIPPAGTEALVGLILRNTATAATTVKLAEADFVGSATLVAITLTVEGEDKLDGGAYIPPLEIIPQAEPAHPVPLSDHVTEVFEVPVTTAVNCRVVPMVTVEVFGDTATVNAGAAATLRVAALLVALPALLVTTTVNDARLSEDVVDGIVYEEEVAPLIATAFFRHW